MGFERWQSMQIRGDVRQKDVFVRFLDFPRAVRALRRSRKKEKEGQTGRGKGRCEIPGREARQPLNLHVLHHHLQQPISESHSFLVFQGLYSNIFSTRVWCMSGFGTESESALFQVSLLMSAALRIRGENKPVPNLRYAQKSGYS